MEAYNPTNLATNHTLVRRNYNLEQHVNNSRLDPQSRGYLVLKLTQKSRTMLETAAWMLDKNQKLPFDGLDSALKHLKNANTSSSLGMVETFLQTQIDEIRKMEPGIEAPGNQNTMTPENKNKCLFLLQGMIRGLSTYNLGINQENTYVPRLEQEEAQVMIEAANLGLDLDKVHQRIHTKEYQNPDNESMKDWEFTDLDQIQKLKEEMAHYKATHKDEYLQNLQRTTTKQAGPQQSVNADGTVDRGVVDLKPAASTNLARFLNGFMAKFNSNNLQDSQKFSELFVDVKKSLPKEVDANVLHKTAFAVARLVVDAGQRSMTMGQPTTTITQQPAQQPMQQNMEGGMTL